MKAVVFSVVITVGTLTRAASVDIGPESVLPVNSEIEYSQFLNFRPGNGKVCRINPPRFAWGYSPSVISNLSEQGKYIPAKFTFQLSTDPKFRRPEIERKSLKLNFLASLPKLDKSKKWFWRVGYDIKGRKERIWSAVRSFSIAPDAIEWDRTNFKNLVKICQEKGHPRMPFTAAEWKQAAALKESSPALKKLYLEFKTQADKIISEPWWNNFPPSDKVEIKGDNKSRKVSCAYYGKLVDDTLKVAFMYKLTGDGKYAGCRRNMLTVAAWAPRGFSSPEGLNGGRNVKDGTGVAACLARYFDWFYHDLTSPERAVLLKSIQFRVNHVLNRFSVNIQNSSPGTMTIAGCLQSHPNQAFFWTAPAAFATAEHLPESEKLAGIALEYIAAVGCSVAPEDGSWNMGFLYDNAKAGTFIQASAFIDMMLPEMKLRKSPFFEDTGEMLTRIVPLGLKYTCTGNWGRVCDFLTARSHYKLMPIFAYMGENGSFLKNFEESLKLPINNSNKREYSKFSLQYAIHTKWELNSSRPKIELEKKTVKAFKTGGWVMAGNRAPSDYSNWSEAVGIVWFARPMGPMGHCFNNDGGFDLYAYGHSIATGGGKTTNHDEYARSTISSNCVAIDGKGQERNLLQPSAPWNARLIAWKETPEAVYFAGDLTNAYAQNPELRYVKKAVRHAVFVRQKYFAFYDMLESGKKDGSLFSWLYHILQDVPVKTMPDGFTYKIGSTNVRVYLWGGDLKFANLRKANGFRNPITGFDYLEDNIKGAQKRHLLQHKTADELRNYIAQGTTANNIWYTSADKRKEQTFLALVIPWKDGMNPPEVKKLSGSSCKVDFAGKSDTISFDPEVKGTFVINAEAITKQSADMEKAFLESPVSVWNFNRKNGIVDAVTPKRGRKQTKKH